MPAVAAMPCDGRRGRGRPRQKTTSASKLFSWTRKTTYLPVAPRAEAVLDLGGRRKMALAWTHRRGRRGRAHRTVCVRGAAIYSPGWLNRTKPYIPRVALLTGSTLMAQFKALAYFTRNASDC